VHQVGFVYANIPRSSVN